MRLLLLGLVSLSACDGLTWGPHGDPVSESGLLMSRSSAYAQLDSAAMSDDGQVFFADPQMDVSDCGSTAGAHIYFDVFYFLGFQFLRSLFIAGMMEQFFAFKSRGSFLLGDGHIESFRRKWRECDPQSAGFIKLFQLKFLCQGLKDDRNPLGNAVLINEFKFGCVRTELIRNAEHAPSSRVQSPSRSSPASPRPATSSVPRDRR